LFSEIVSVSLLPMGAPRTQKTVSFDRLPFFFFHEICVEPVGEN